MPKEAKQQAEARSTQDAQTSNGLKQRTRAKVTFRDNTEIPGLSEMTNEETKLVKQELKATAHGRHLKIKANILGNEVQIIIDSGATGNYMDPRVQEKLKILKRQKPVPIPLTRLNGEELTENRIIEEIGWLPMIIDKHFKMINFDIVKLGQDDVILGIPWLRKHNPAIHWDKEQLQLTRCNCKTTQTIKASQTKGDLEITIKKTINTPLQDETKGMVVTDITEEKQQLISSTDIVLPTEYEQFRDLFNRTYKTLPDHSEWDYTILLKKGKKPVP